MKRFLLPLCLLICGPASAQALFPANGAEGVNPDTRLVITTDSTPTIGAKGFVRIFDAATGKQVDALDLSIPAGPTVSDRAGHEASVYSPTPYPYQTTDFTNANTKPGTPSGEAKPGSTSTDYQLTIIGRFTDGFHFHPIIVRGNAATIYPHHNLLEYGKKYRVNVDVEGLPKIDDWTFSTRAAAPAAEVRRLVVSNDGPGDFSTVQGAMDFIPDFSDEKWEVFIRNGRYEEIVYFRNKKNVTLRGESRDGVVICYANNEVFNPHPKGLRTNEWPGTFPSRRAAFTADNCTDLVFKNMTIQTTLRGQAEGLLLMGERNALYNVRIIGSGDALQVNGSTYFVQCLIEGDGDTILGRGPSFFQECTISSNSIFMWIRNTSANHGNIFDRCTFIGCGPNAVFARAPLNGGQGYPYAEAVLLNCRLENVPDVGWGAIGGDGKNNRFWEFDSRALDGRPIDVSKRHELSRQLDAAKDAETIKNYRDPAWVLGWNPLN